jgi:hypothetical protein
VIDEVAEEFGYRAREFAAALSDVFFEGDASQRAPLRTRLTMEYAWFFLHLVDRVSFQRLGDPGRINLNNAVRPKVLATLLSEGLTAEQVVEFRQFFMHAYNVRAQGYACVQGLATHPETHAKGVFDCFGEMVYLLTTRPLADDWMSVMPHRCYATAAEAVKEGETDRITDFADYATANDIGARAGLDAMRLVMKLLPETKETRR